VYNDNNTNAKTGITKTISKPFQRVAGWCEAQRFRCPNTSSSSTPKVIVGCVGPRARYSARVYALAVLERSLP
jgi:phage host-nuclease inhibitor protein Gam